MTDKETPWSLIVVVAQIPETGLHRDFAANAIERRALAGLAGLREVSVAEAALDLAPMRGGRVHVTGRVRGRVGQTCVVTLEPVENDIDEAIDLVFAPPEQIPTLAHLIEQAGNSDAAIPDPPEPIVDGAIDLGRIATDALFLAIDPYPRKPGVVFDAPAFPPDPEDHPFAALKSLKRDSPSAKR